MKLKKLSHALGMGTLGFITLGLGGLPLETHARVFVEQTAEPGIRYNFYLRKNGFIPSEIDPKQVDIRSFVLHRKSLIQDQSLLKSKLNTDLVMHGHTAPSMLKALEHLENTGRLTVFDNDTDSLRFKREQNPLLEVDDQISYSRPASTVLVIGSNSHCKVPFQSTAAAKAYVVACIGEGNLLNRSKQVDHAWLVQPNGEIHKLGLGAWNPNEQPTPMPGAFIVAQQRGDQLNQAVFARFAQLLATQGSSVELSEKLHATAAVSMSESSKGRFQEMAIEAPNRNIPLTNNDFGNAGIFQTPTARMHPAGTFGVTISKVDLYNRYAFTLQPTDWFEGTLRYTKTLNIPFAPGITDEKNLDKAFDFKLRLLKEGAYTPSLALGMTDIGGTSLFTSEYLVASKRHKNFDFSLGLGWGYMGRQADFSNPLSKALGEEFNQRPQTNFGVGGEFEIGSAFKGPAALFGGVQWHTPINGLVLKAELDGNNYQNDFAGALPQSSRVNFGASYQLTPSIAFTISQQRGEVLGFALSMTPNLATERAPKLIDPAPVPVLSGPRPSVVNWQKTIAEIERQTTWDVTKVEKSGTQVQLTVVNNDAPYPNEALDKASAVLHRDLPENYQWFGVNYEINGMKLAENTVDRKAFVSRRADHREPNLEIRDSSDKLRTNAPNNGVKPMPDQSASDVFQRNTEVLFTDKKDKYNGGFSLGYQQVFGGQDGILFQFYGAYTAQYNLNDSTWIGGRAAYRLFDNYDKFDEVGSSALPPVRTNQKEYLITSDFTIRRLYLAHMGELGNRKHFYAAYGGLLEDMFAGVGAEYLYRPFQSPVAVGMNLNRVKQRGFRQDFELQDYAVNTGHVTGYVDTGIQDILLKVSVGQYLAGDRGVTVDLSRQFLNGTTMGVFATKTDVSAEQFGEGSFDKGIYISFPWDVLVPGTAAGNAGIVYRPLTRDGGAMLGRPVDLYTSTAAKDKKTFERRAQ